VLVTSNLLYHLRRCGSTIIIIAVVIIKLPDQAIASTPIW
jgi:hypothetical protein